MRARPLRHCFDRAATTTSLVPAVYSPPSAVSRAKCDAQSAPLVFISWFAKWRVSAPALRKEDFVFPKSFILRDVVAIVAPVFAYSTSPYEHSADVQAREWFKGAGMYDDTKRQRFLDRGNFAHFASMAFPNADEYHFVTCLYFFLWAFASDDLWDSPETQKSQLGVDACMNVLQNPTAPRPVTEPTAAMLHDILSRMRSTAKPETIRRFARNYEAWAFAALVQGRRRNRSVLPTVDEFIALRRDTIGQGAVEAIIEYSLDIDLPDEIFAHPIMAAMSEATTDILTWPNDLISFNKEQADGDYQNFVCVLMAERNLDVQTAVDTLTNMVAARVRDYVDLKKQLPSFGDAVDRQLAIYLRNIEHEAYASVQWYYDSPRYFKGPITDRTDLLIEVWPRKLQ